ncbi:ATP-binding cassette domain-containing protein [Streptomyces melanogenes]|uniref:ATP-binding cassette domain-containing protein n=1 Tax=Streptomyces melanogenes TaxID=67326 RepID=UPI0037A59BDF
MRRIGGGGRGGGPGAGGDQERPEDDVAASEPELFGSRLRLGGGYTAHDLAGADARTFSVLAGLPSFLRKSAVLAWDAGRGRAAALAAVEVSRGAIAALGLVATNALLMRLFAGGDVRDRLTEALPSMGWLLAVATLTTALAAASTTLSGSLEPQVERRAMLLLLRRSARVELAAMESGDFQRLLHSAQRGTVAARQMTRNSLQVLHGLVVFASAAVVLVTLHPVLLPLLLAAALPKGWGAARSARRSYRSTQTWLEHARRNQVLARLLLDRDSAPELRVHGAAEYLVESFDRMSREAAGEQARLSRAAAGTTALAGALAGLAAAGVYGLLVLLVMGSWIPLAAAGTAAIAVRTATAQLDSLVQQVNSLYEQALFHADLEAACRMAGERKVPGGGGRVRAAPAAISLREVSFRYAGVREPALDSVSLEITKGQIVALVGPNGAGKTTLSRLLCGLYTPERGSVRWDGRDLRTLRRADVHERIALVSQTFTQWPFTARTNVAIARPEARADGARLRRAAADSGFADVAERLPRGWDTLLAPEFVGGVELSGGQWQRAALARAAFRGADILVYDEPTAALDPQTEIEFFDRIRELARGGQTVVLVTHRLASVRHADQIFFLDRGRLVESGSFAELLDHDGRFARLYRMQAEQYAAAPRSRTSAPEPPVSPVQPGDSAPAPAPESLREGNRVA